MPSTAEESSDKIDNSAMDKGINVMDEGGME